MRRIIHWHKKGTLFGIKVDPEDGLLKQGVPGKQLTWMDAKVDDCVITPRHGKAIEICALWINALRIMSWLSAKLDKPHEEYNQLADQAEISFNNLFWREDLSYYLDVAEPEDASLRPNQVIAMSLPFSPMRGVKAKKALQIVHKQLLTPMGLRTLGPCEPNYQGKYQGNLKELDAAYHQGTVWPWLLGPYVTSVVKLTGDKKRAREILEPIQSTLLDYGLGGIAEVYDGDPPHRPNGCPWQAISIAEILRAWLEDATSQ